ncbi:MAG: PEGA domain-containing protein [Kofleriaceae bacterium]|nr:PEGA domain-containing protein [Kofleriaceae bacterium]
MRVWLGFVVALLLAAPARAEDADTLRKDGEVLARQGSYAAAIEKFKAADRLAPRAAHACMIGLSYMRRKLWAQAELYFTRCTRRAESGETLPDWVPAAKEQLAAGLAESQVTPVVIEVIPAGVAAEVTVSSLPGETFDPQTIHLPAGSYAITVKAPGFATQEQTIELFGTRAPVRASFTLVAEAPPPLRTRDVSRRRWSNRLFIVGGVAAVGGAVAHALAWNQRGKLEDARLANDLEGYRDNETAFDVTRTLTFTLYGVTAVSVGAALYLRMTGNEPPVQVSAGFGADRAMVTIGWSR